MPGSVGSSVVMMLKMSTLPLVGDVCCPRFGSPIDSRFPSILGSLVSGLPFLVSESPPLGQVVLFGSGLPLGVPLDQHLADLVVHLLDFLSSFL